MSVLYLVLTGEPRNRNDTQHFARRNRIGFVLYPERLRVNRHNYSQVFNTVSIESVEGDATSGYRDDRHPEHVFHYSRIFMNKQNSIGFG